MLYLAIFITVLLISIITGISIVWALVAGYLIFFTYAIKKGKGFKEIMTISLHGIYEARNILTAFILIGMLTASWRASGTIASIICYALPMIRSQWFLAAVFVINSLISFLTGTSFGSAATMGVICMTMANAIGINPILSGGAVLSGIFFGDRCSPVSTSALLVADLTKTKVVDNIPGMMKTSILPFVISLATYWFLSLTAADTGTSSSSLSTIFYENFDINLPTLIPALLMLILSILRLGTKKTMAVSMISALIICVFLQKMEIADIPSMLFFGFKSSTEELSAIMDGGGVTSMVNVALIVALSSSFSGIFQETGMRDGIKEKIESAKTRPSVIITLISAVTCMIACNQTLATMLTHQLCSGLESDRRKMALALENTVIVISALVPWSIAGSVPLTVIGAPILSIAAAFYLFLLPICYMASK